MRVASEFGSGKAKVHLSFPAWKIAKVQPATIEVPVGKAAASVVAN